MNLYSGDVKIYATIYIKAENMAEAQAKLAALKDSGMELRQDETDDPEGWSISGRQYDDPDLPDVSLSPAMTFVGLDAGDELELNEFGIDADWEKNGE